METGIGTHHERVLDALPEVGVAREAIEVIAPTHLHLNHAGGAGFLTEACPNATVVVHESGVLHLLDPDQLAEGTKQVVGDRWQFYTDLSRFPRTESAD